MWGRLSSHMLPTKTFIGGTNLWLSSIINILQARKAKACLKTTLKTWKNSKEGEYRKETPFILPILAKDETKIHNEIMKGNWTLSNSTWKTWYSWACPWDPSPSGWAPSPSSWWVSGAFSDQTSPFLMQRTANRTRQWAGLIPLPKACVGRLDLFFSSILYHLSVDAFVE